MQQMAQQLGVVNPTAATISPAAAAGLPAGLSTAATAYPYMTPANHHAAAAAASAAGVCHMAIRPLYG